MTKLPSIQTIQSGFNSQETINSNFLALQQAFSNTLSRDGSVPNFMSADLDLNGNNLLNVSSIFVDGVDLVATLTDYLTQALDAKESAQTDAVSAANSASSAATSAVNAAVSENNSAASATSAATSSASAATSATNSAVSATNAATSEANALAYANDALASRSSAATSETNAAASAAQAGGFASDAATHAASASASADQALAALDSFDDRYLGQKVSDPTLDNDGNPLVAGALYFNTTDNVMKVYEGSMWVAAYASLSGALLSSNNLSDVLNVGAARNNLNLGSTDSVSFGSVTTTGRVVAGQGSGGVALTHNDGQGNANVTFNHNGGVPEQDGNAARIDVNTDSTSNPAMTFKVVGNVSAGVNTGFLPVSAKFTDTSQYLNFSGDQKLQTTTNGVNITGTLLATGQVQASGGTSDNWNTAYGWGDHSTVGYLTDATAFATASQGLLADSAVQPTDLATVATSGTYSDLTGVPFEVVSSVQISAVSSLVLTDLDFDTYDYIVKFRGVRPQSDNSVFFCRVSQDNGVTFDSGSSAYLWGWSGTSTASLVGSGDNSDNILEMTAGVGNNTGNNEWGFTSEVIMSKSPSSHWTLTHQTTYRNAAGANIALQGHGIRGAGGPTITVDAVLFSFVSSNIFEGYYTLYRRVKG